MFRIRSTSNSLNSLILESLHFSLINLKSDNLKKERPRFDP